MTVDLITEGPLGDRRAGSVCSRQTPDGGTIHVLGRTERDGTRSQDAARNGMGFKTDELFVSGMF